VSGAGRHPKMGGPTPSILMQDISVFDQSSTWLYHARSAEVASVNRGITPVTPNPPNQIKIQHFGRHAC
jgi:hypothetical protein